MIEDTPSNIPDSPPLPPQRRSPQRPQPPFENPRVRSFTASDGYCLHFHHWQADQPRGIVVALHGIQSHAGWYKHSCRAMCDAGFDVYFADRRGSGLNLVQRGHAEHGMRLINDVRQLVHQANGEHESINGRLPLTLLGISWGAKVAVTAASLEPKVVDKLALLYPGLEPHIRPTALQLLQLKIARRLEIRHKMIRIPLEDPALFTSSDVWQKFIANDPQALHQVTTGFLNAATDLDKIFRHQDFKITQPALLMLAGRDQIINNSGTRELVSRFSRRHLTTLLYPNARHTLEFEPDRDQFFTDLIRWLEIS